MIKGKNTTEKGKTAKSKKEKAKKTDLFRNSNNLKRKGKVFNYFQSKRKIIPTCQPDGDRVII
ncbi:hypothetical protein B5V88_17655 [Heyndrickxia sporothermodurans]|uniref:Ribosomal protein S12 n=1 Tax=Heyndrickxia sporothermodurans TaxID=46224 RepID=A0AB37HHW6_9BACI|nr:hypothetical protein [Heyndrickxia sporothermodurans]MBL5772878.1 hypothetical protein [Heyndrickxia sporothermodurans]MBL5779875.1 hypothetical protein [Heyndrickxia sporothermodurans]MBL5786984.1 hypothetical protein [Heyndrickxia sporothermodurans]MBL5790577.1 hypothetical protein [Heyndrickxia sporothermodurans]MBL5794350.1 hypothetical protein [Heyndrickxia sporothermodurans]